MEGVTEEGKGALEKDEEDSSFEFGLIGAALGTEHYEIAGYEACVATDSITSVPRWGKGKDSSRPELCKSDHT